MELSPEIQTSLSTLCTSIGVTEFTHLAEQSIAAAASASASGEPEIEIDGVDPAVVKQLYAALVTIALEAAKHGLDSGVSDVFVDHGVDKERASAFGRVFAANAGRLRDRLRETGFGPPRVVDVDWRLGLEVRSSELEHVSSANYVVTFKLDRGPDVVFVCSADELVDMSSKFADASKQLDRLTQQ